MCTVYVCMYILEYVNIYLYIHIYTYIYLYIYIYTHNTQAVIFMYTSYSCALAWTLMTYELLQKQVLRMPSYELPWRKPLRIFLIAVLPVIPVGIYIYMYVFVWHINRWNYIPKHLYWLWLICIAVLPVIPVGVDICIYIYIYVCFCLTLTDENCISKHLYLYICCYLHTSIYV
jgi:hypothetical protein